MLLKSSKDFESEFLLIFTREILENTKTYRNLNIKTEIQAISSQKDIQQKKAEEAKQAQKEEIKGIIQTKIKEDKKKLSDMKSLGLSGEIKSLSRPIEFPVRRIISQKFSRQPILRIPEPNLPPTVSYLTPVATQEQLELGKLNALVNDPLVKIIECDGADQNVFVIGIMGRKPTQIKLSNDEINAVVQDFSSASKIPLEEGLFKAAVGRLVISAVISDIVGTKFIIRKISPAQF